MVIPIKLKDDPLMRDIPDTATRFEYENMILVILHPEKKEFDLLMINKETPDIHYHIFQEKGEVYFLKTYYENGIKKHESIDIEKSLRSLGNILSEIFSKIEKLDRNDPKLANETVYFQTIHPMFLKKKTENKVIFGQLYEVEEVPWDKINTDYHKLGFSFDDNGNEKYMVFVKDGDIFRLALRHLDFEDQELFS